MPDTAVPWAWVIRVGVGSAALVQKFQEPSTMFPDRSGWFFSSPSSMTATLTAPVIPSCHAVVSRRSWSAVPAWSEKAFWPELRRCHCWGKSGSRKALGSMGGPRTTRTAALPCWPP